MRSRPTGRASWPPLIVLVGLGATLALPRPALAGPLAQSLDFLAAHQDSAGGGFAAQDGTAPGYTAWAALAVTAAGEDTRRWRRGPVSLRVAVARPAADAGLGDLERAVVAIAAAGGDARVAGGRNRLREILAAQHYDGVIGSDASTTAWGVLALTASGFGRGSRAVRSAATALERTQRPDGGWSLVEEDPRSGPNTTAAAIQALVAAGRDPEESRALRRARAFLLSAQNRDGGFPPVAGGTSTALTTAWVTLAIRALDERPSDPPWSRHGGPLRLLRVLQRADGGVRNAAGAATPSVWATSQAALAFSGKHLPYVRRSPRPMPLRAPWVVGRRPRNGGRVEGHLAVRYRDDPGGTGVDADAVRLVVGGRDVTARARVTPWLATVPASLLPPGRSTVHLTLADRAGNARSVRWRVVVPDR